MYVTNVLLQDGTELALRANAVPRWSPNRFLSHTQAIVDPARAAADRAEGIFRVWLPTASKTPDWASDPPLTDAARATWQSYDAGRDDPVIDCTAPGMPQVITRSGRYAIRFVNGRGHRTEERVSGDRSVIAHDGAAAGERRAPTPLGYSTGKWTAHRSS